MRKNRKNQRINGTIKGLVCKAGLVVTLAMGCTVASFQGMIPNSYHSVYAATESSLSEQTPSFTITKRSATTATISIQRITQASYYKIYRSTSKNGTYSYVGQTSNPTYTDKGLTANRVYYYKIKALNGAKESQYSKKVKVSATLGKVSNLKASYTNSNVKMTWNYLNGASKYKVYRATSKSGVYEYIGSTSMNAYTDTTVQAGNTYYYKVRGMKTVSNVKYNGVYSTKVSVNCSTPSSGSTESNSSFIDEVLRLVNIERAKEGLSELTTNTSLKNAAHQRAIEIKSVFSHDRPDGSSCFTVLKEFNISYRAAGENIAYGQKTPAQVVEGWMNSEGHRANILSSKFGKIGIGCYYNNGTYYWTQLFTN